MFITHRWIDTKRQWLFSVSFFVCERRKMITKERIRKERKQRETEKRMETLCFLEDQIKDVPAIQDADTILGDIVGEADLEITGIAYDLLKLYKESGNKEDVDACFEILTGRSIQEYLERCIEIIASQSPYKQGKLLTYRGYHFLPVEKKEDREEILYPLQKTEGDDVKELEEFQKLQEERKMNLFLCMENYCLYVFQNEEIFVYLPDGRRNEYADKYFLGRKSAN